MKKLVISFLVTTTLFTFLSPHGSAYQLFSEDHPYSTVSLDTTKTLTYYLGSSFEQSSSANLNEALYLWNKNSGHSLMRRDPNKRHNVTDYGKPSSFDSLNLVYKIAVNADYVGENTLRVNNYIVYESDINLNAKYDFTDGKAINKWDTFSLFLHESGHTTGLCDIYNPYPYEKDSVMIGDWSTRSNSISWRSLRQDDINGLKVLYP